MELNILKKDVIDESIVQDITESPLQVNSYDDKAIVNLFEVPLHNVILSQPTSSEVNFHGINLSVKKYTEKSENLTNFIGENRHIEKESIHIISDENSISELPLQTCSSRNERIKTSLNMSEQERGSTIENETVKPDLKQCQDFNEHSQKSKMHTDEPKKSLPCLLDIMLSPVQNAPNNKPLEENQEDIEFISEYMNEQVKKKPLPKKLEQHCLFDATLSPVQMSCDMEVLTDCQKETKVSEEIDVKLECNLKLPLCIGKTTEKQHKVNSSGLSLVVSTPKFIRDAPKRNSSEISDLKRKTLYFEQLSNSSDITKPVAFETHKSPSRHQTEKSPVELRDRDANLQIQIENLCAKSKQSSGSEIQNVIDEPPNVHTFLSPKSAPKKLTVNTSTTKRELFSSKDFNISDSNNNNDTRKLSVMTEKDDSVCDNNMSVEEEGLANSFLNMSVDDIDPKIDLCRSAKKLTLIVIDEVNEEIAEVKKGPTDKLKSYEIPFISSNIEENDDNNNNEWNYLKSLDTDEARYQVVRKIWKNRHIPDPNINLSCFNYYHKSKKSSNYNENVSNRKRQREDGDDNAPKAKRGKFNNVNFFCRNMHETRRIVETNYRRDQSLIRNNFHNVQRLRGRFDEKIMQLEKCAGEVEAFHRFYRGLPNQTEHNQQNVECEQTNVNKMYDRFRQLYGWSGRAFQHRVPI